MAGYTGSTVMEAARKTKKQRDVKIMPVLKKMFLLDRVI
jgi:hypothetical protein